MPLKALDGGSDYEFLGWWSIPRDEVELSEKYDANTPIYKLVDLIARWRWLGDEQEGVFLKKLYDNMDSFKGFDPKIYEYIISLNPPQSDITILKMISFEPMNVLSSIECVLLADGEIISTLFMNEGKIYNAQTELPDGSTVALPKNPNRQGYIF